MFAAEQVLTGESAEGAETEVAWASCPCPPNHGRDARATRGETTESAKGALALGVRHPRHTRLHHRRCTRPGRSQRGLVSLPAASGTLFLCPRWAQRTANRSSRTIPR